MKKLLVAAFLVVGMTASAQSDMQPAQTKPSPEKEIQKEKMSAEQRNELHLKKLTLELGLKPDQQKEMAVIITEQSAKREIEMAERKSNEEKGVQLTADERFAKESKRLDDQIAVKARVKKILTVDQFKKWEELQADKKEKMQQKKAKGKGKGKKSK